MSKLELIQLRIDVLRLQERYVDILACDPPGRELIEKKYYEFLEVLDRAIKDIIEREAKVRRR